MGSRCRRGRVLSKDSAARRRRHLCTRRSTAIITIVSTNLLDYDGVDPDQTDRSCELEVLLRNQNPDIIAVQELISSGNDKREAATIALHKLAEDLGLRCTVNGVPAVALSRTRHHTGLLWREEIDVVDLMRYDSDDYSISHGMTVAVFDLGGPKLKVGSVHLSHFDPGLSGGWQDTGQVMRAFNRDQVPGLACGDWQGIGADEDYDADPYAGVPWDPSHAYHYDLNGNVDRHAAIRLERHGRFRDCARIAGANWQATTGHHATDTNQPRRIDRIYATHHFPDAALISFRTVDPEVVGQCTDHCPVLVEVDQTGL